MAPLDKLRTICERPALIEHAVRTALVEAMKWRLGGGAAPGQAAFACAAVAAVRQQGTRLGVASAALIEVAAATERAAIRFFSSSLGKRLMCIPAAQIVAAPCSWGGADVAVRDSANHLHLIALTALRRPLEIGEQAGLLAEQTEIATYDRLAPLQIHLYSLPTGNRLAYRRWPGRVCATLARTA